MDIKKAGSILGKLSFSKLTPEQLKLRQEHAIKIRWEKEKKKYTKCLVCNSPLPTKRSLVKFCSIKCKYKHYNHFYK